MPCAGQSCTRVFETVTLAAWLKMQREVPPVTSKLSKTTQFDSSNWTVLMPPLMTGRLPLTATPRKVIFAALVPEVRSVTAPYVWPPITSITSPGLSAGSALKLAYVWPLPTRYVAVSAASWDSTAASSSGGWVQANREREPRINRVAGVFFIRSDSSWGRLWLRPHASPGSELCAIPAGEPRADPSTEEAPGGAHRRPRLGAEYEGRWRSRGPISRAGAVPGPTTLSRTHAADARQNQSSKQRSP